MAAIATTPGTSRGRRRAANVPPTVKPSAPWSIALPDGLGPIAEVEFAVLAVAREWLGDVHGNVEYEFENLKVDDSPNRVDFTTNVNGGEGKPFIRVNFQGFLVSGSIVIDNNPERLPNSLAWSDLAAFNATATHPNGVWLTVERSAGKVTVTSTPDEVPQQELAWVDDWDAFFTWARNYKPGPTNVIKLPPALGGGEAYRARPLPEEPGQEVSTLADHPSILAQIPSGGQYSVGTWVEFGNLGVKPEKLLRLGEGGPEHAILSTVLGRWFGDDCAPLPIFGDLAEEFDDRREVGSPESESVWFYIQLLDQPERWTVELRGFGMRGVAYIFLNTFSLKRNPLADLRATVASAYGVAETLVDVRLELFGWGGKDSIDFNVEGGFR